MPFAVFSSRRLSVPMRWASESVQALPIPMLFSYKLLIFFIYNILVNDYHFSFFDTRMYSKNTYDSK